MGNLTLSDLNQSNRNHMLGNTGSNQFQKTTVLNNIPNNMRTLESQENKSQKLNNLRFHSFVEKLWVKKRLIQIHQNICQKRCNYKDYTHFDLLDEIDQLTTNQHVSQGLSKLSDIDSHFQISRQDMSYQTAINPRQMRTLNPQISSSSMTELDDLRKQREDSEAIINNLRKTIKDMARQMKQMEIKLDSNSLGNISPKARSQVVSREKLDQMGSQYMMYELEQKNQEIDDIKTEHGNYTRQLKDKFKDKFNEQNKFIDELKAELAKKSSSFEVQRLENQVSMLQRQITMQRNQASTDIKMHESDQIRLQSSKEQEKHWKCGYESIFQKYTQLKDQMTKREDEIRRKEWDNETKFKALTRKAEEAINYFKNLAMKQEMRQGRFNETSRSTLQDDYKLRSRGANLGLEPIDDLKIKQYQSSTLTRAGQINPAKEYLGTTHKSYLSTQKQDYIRSHSNHCSTKKSYSPIRSEKNGMAIRFRGNEIRGSSQEYQGMLSPKAQQKMNFIERIQSDLTKETEKSTCNTKLFLALEALEKSFLEINKYKRETTDLSMKYFARNCDHLQDFQVLSYDYMSQIDQHLAREATLQKELAKKDTQISSLRDIISQSKRIIQSLLEQIKEQKQIKELQWKNIIQYDTVKDQEKKRVDETIDQEMQIGKKIIQDLHTEILGRESMIDNKNNVIQHLEEQKHQIQNSMSQLRSTHDDTLQHLQIVQDEKQDLEKRLEMIQEQIKQILFGTCGVPEGEVYQPTTQRQMLSEQKQMYINHDSENMLEGQMTPQLRSEFSAAGEFVINSNRYQGSPAQIENQMQSFEHLNHINQCINGLLQRILNDGQYIASLNQIVDEEQVQQSNTQETGDFKPHQETFKSQSLDSFINNQQRQYPNESQSQDLRAFVQTQYTQQNIPERESLDQVDEGSVCQSDAPDVDRCTLQQKLQQLITANQLKGETIEQLQNEIQKVNEEYNNLDHHTSVAMNDLHMEIKKLTSEKEQINQVYQQENQMRQELEGLCEEKSMAIDEAKQQISQCEMDLEHLQEQHDNVATEKERLTQSNEYWQNSFKLIESHFLEQKEKAKKEMNRLNDEINKYESDLIQKNSNIGRMQDHIKTLEEELLPLKRAKHDSRVATCQTDVKFTQIESLFRLEDENNQIKADIQHLIESYENFKNDSSKTQKNLQDRINQLENQKRTQQTYEADRLSHQLLSSQQHVQDLQNQLSNVEKDKEEAELQLISQKDQIDQLTQFNQVVQNFNQQLQMQLQSYSSFNTTNQANQNSAKYFNQGTDREQFQTYDQEQRNSQFSFLDGQRQKINNASQSQSFTNTQRVAQNQLTSMSNGQSNGMTPAPYQQDRDHDTSLGLDMCQQCIEHESTIQSQQDQIRKLITNQVQSTRKLTSMCMEGAILLRSESIKVKEHNIQSRKRNQSYDFERVNLSTISEPEQKTQSIRQAQKFLEKNLEYFMGASATKKLLKYSDTMINIAQHIVQNSCEIQMKYQQSVLNRTSSLKIDDYHSDQFSDKACQIELRDKTESTGREMRVDTLTGEPAVLSGNRNEAIVYRRTVPDHVIQKIEYLGVSLDNKIGIFVKLLGSIKKLSKDDRIKKMMQALTGTISKAIHDLTLDTEQLNDIKSELENQQVTESSLSHHLPLNKEKWEDARETAAFQKSSSASETQKVRIQPQTIMQMNFVNEDGRTLTDTNRSKIPQNPQMFKNYNYHITNSSKTIALSKGVNSSPFLNTENNVSNRQYYEDAVAQKFVPPVNEETETDSEIQQYPLNDTGGMETLIQDISHHFKDKCTLSPRAFLNQSSNANSNQELEKCRSYMKTINDQQNMLNNMSSNYKYHGALHNTLDTSNVSNKGPVSNFAKRQYGMNLNQTISQPPKHQHHISLRDPNIVSSQNFNNQSLLVEQENNFNSLDPRKKTNYERSHSFQKFGTSSVSISNYSDFKK